MNVENLKVLQLGKFYPIRGGVEKVAFDLMKGLSERGIGCHMLCAAEEGEDRIILLNEHALHIPADTRSAFPVISVQSPVSIQCCWQS